MEVLRIRQLEVVKKKKAKLQQAIVAAEKKLAAKNKQAHKDADPSRDIITMI